ncbi:hypothetical protein NBT05_04400 [Aquimarina sp. ERC-38]|uniref:hypothetical protein n=1 Tax=Aquimarina sp. ERC-38 TaxID=2949996 RepID=UPI002245807F|nr:hypothetical protein [Aquimarina sp. ERC-38]UZO81713.1 hypothetical protein NBT05_04400 [Aquimarina sp. ERC-38]
MGLKISTIAAIPENVNRDYLYILDYYNWDEPIGNTLRNSFDKIAKFASENNSIAIQGIPESHFYSELWSWESINGIDPKELLPALMITTIHPKYFLERNDKDVKKEKNSEDKLVFIKIAKVCKTPRDVLKLIEKIFSDIQNHKKICDFQVKSELSEGIGKILNDTIILEPDIAGVGININNICKFLSKKQLKKIKKSI